MSGESIENKLACPGFDSEPSVLSQLMHYDLPLAIRLRSGNLFSEFSPFVWCDCEVQ